MLRYNTILRSSFLMLDLFLLNITCFLSGYFVFLQSGGDYPIFWNQYLLIVNLLWLFITSRTKFYFTEITYILLLRRTISINIFHISMMVVCFFLIRESQVSKSLIPVQSSLQFLSILLSRYLYLKVKEKLHPIRYDSRRVVIVGDCELSGQAAEKFRRPDSGYRLLGFFNIYEKNNELDFHSISQKMNYFLDYSIKNKVNEIYSTVLPNNTDEWQKIIKRAEEHFIRIKFIPNFESIFSHKVNWRIEQGMPVISLRKEPLELIENRIVKRVFDITFSLLIFILILWWLIPILAIVIKITSKGPVFFVQKRSGRNGDIFNCFKLRSMYINHDSDLIAADKNDERFTPIGRFLRKSNLDELPQFFNVLRGEMSVIGPRPHMLKHTEEYSKIIDKFMVRHFLKPGITGWAQVNGFRGDLTGDKMEKRVEYDVWYLENWSFLLDLSVAFKTIRLTLKGDDNAY